MNIPGTPNSDDDIRADSAKAAARRKRVLAILGCVVLLAVMVILHLTGVLGERLHQG